LHFLANINIVLENDEENDVKKALIEVSWF